MGTGWHLYHLFTALLTVIHTYVGAIVFACVLGSALITMLLRQLLPEAHLSTESKDVVKLGIALIATMAALVLSLLLHSAKSSFDARNCELVQMAADIVLLDRLLAHYGPEAKPARESLRAAVEMTLGQIWPTRTFMRQVSPLPQPLRKQPTKRFSRFCHKTRRSARCGRKR